MISLEVPSLILHLLKKRKKKKKKKPHLIAPQSKQEARAVLGELKLFAPCG